MKFFFYISTFYSHIILTAQSRKKLFWNENVVLSTRETGTGVNTFGCKKYRRQFNAQKRKSFLFTAQKKKRFQETRFTRENKNTEFSWCTMCVRHLLPYKVAFINLSYGISQGGSKIKVKNHLGKEMASYKFWGFQQKTKIFISNSSVLENVFICNTRSRSRQYCIGHIFYLNWQELMRRACTAGE